MGAPHSGTKSELIIRLLSLRIVRMELRSYTADFAGAQAMAQAFKRERLRWMCEQSNLWKSGNKVALGGVLLKWREDCRRRGQEYLEACMAYTKTSGIQLEIEFA